MGILLLTQKKIVLLDVLHKTYLKRLRKEEQKKTSGACGGGGFPGDRESPGKPRRQPEGRRDISRRAWIWMGTAQAKVSRSEQGWVIWTPRN